MSSDLCSKWNRLHDIGDIKIPKDHRGSGSATLALHDLQLTQMKGEFEPISEPLPIFEFDFGKLNGEPIPYNRQSVKDFHLLRKDKEADAIFTWWDLKMDPKKTITLSCAPLWSHPDRIDFEKEIREMVRRLFKIEILFLGFYKDFFFQPWRDHWMQSIYYPINSPSLEPEMERLSLISDHGKSLSLVRVLMTIKCIFLFQMNILFGLI